MPTGDHMSVSKLQAALADGSVSQAAINDSVHRILRTIIRVGLLDGPIKRDNSLVNSETHKKLAYEAATKGIILLKNDSGLLPINRDRVHSIAVIGEPARKMQVGALGSPEVQPTHTAQILDAITQQAARSGIKVAYAAARTVGDPVRTESVLLPDGSGAHGFRAE
jgi:beta-glucosidase